MTADDRTNAGQPGLVTIPEASARLGKSERTIRRMIRSGKLNAVEIGGKSCVQLADTDTDRQVSGEGVQVTANAGENDRRV